MSTPNPALTGDSSRQDGQTSICDPLDDLDSPEDIPPSCNPLLLVDDDFRAEYVAAKMRDFHRELYRKLEIIAAQSDDQPVASSRKRKRNIDASISGCSSIGSDQSRRGTKRACSVLTRSSTQDSYTTLATPLTADTRDDIRRNTFRLTNGTYATPPSSNSPQSVKEVMSTKADFSWWQPLTPTPPMSPRLKATKTEAVPGYSIHQPFSLAALTSAG